jgi:hypothetical protein
MFGSSPASKYHVPRPGYEPKVASAPVEQFIAEVYEAIMACYEHRATLLRMKPVHSDVSPVLAAAITQLKSLKDIIIKPADKNMGMVVLDKGWYQGECDRLLGDRLIYAEVPADQIPQLLDKMRHELVSIVTRWRQLCQMLFIST